METIVARFSLSIWTKKKDFSFIVITITITCDNGDPTGAVNVGVVKTVKLQLSQRSGGQRPTDLQIVTQWLRNLHLLLLWSILWRWVPWSQGWWRRCWLFPAGILRTCRQEHRGVQEPGLDQNPVCSLGRCLLKWGCQTPAPPPPHSP